MTENNDNAAAKKPPAPANPNATGCNGCDHKKTAAMPEKRKTPLLPEPPKQTTSSAAASMASIPVFPTPEKQATKRPHSATTTTSAVTVTAVDPASTITLTVAPFTGGPFSLKMRKTDSVEDLKKAVAKKLKVLKDRICLLYRER